MTYHLQLDRPILNILFLEDNTDLAEEVVFFLAQNYIQTTHVTTLPALTQALENTTYPLLILDRLLADGDVLEQFSYIKKQHTGYIIVLSALGMSEARIAGLNSGADYYLVKPVDLNELLAVIHSAYRKMESQHQHNWLLLEAKKAIQTPSHIDISLTGSEFNLIKALQQYPNQVIPRDDIVHCLGFDTNEYDLRRLDTLVCRLRRKIRIRSQEDIPIQTFSKVGYAWKIDPIHSNTYFL